MDNKLDDKRIRAILIEYLKGTHDKIRIYQEKSIGSSICDVMSVTEDSVTGYEIKSDLEEFSEMIKWHFF